MSAVNSRPNVDKMQNQIFDFYIFEDFHKAPVLTSEHLIHNEYKISAAVMDDGVRFNSIVFA